MVAYIALFVALGGSAYAVTGTSSPVIQACYARKTGALRLLRSGRCAHDERLLSWNQEGLPGATGPQGPPGTADTSQFFTKSQADGRYLPLAGIAANSSELGGQPPSAFAQSADVYTESQSDARYLPIGGTAANSSELGGLGPAAFAGSNLFGSPASVSAGSAGDPSCILGEIKLTATTLASLPTNWTLAHGQALSISATRHYSRCSGRPTGATELLPLTCQTSKGQSRRAQAQPAPTTRSAPPESSRRRSEHRHTLHLVLVGLRGA